MPIFKWFMARLVVQNGHQNDIYYDEIWTMIWRINTILHSIIWRGANFASNTYNFCVCAMIIKLAKITIIWADEAIPQLNLTVRKSYGEVAPGPHTSMKSRTSLNWQLQCLTWASLQTGGYGLIMSRNEGNCHAFFQVPTPTWLAEHKVSVRGCGGHLYCQWIHVWCLYQEVGIWSTDWLTAV